MRVLCYFQQNLVFFRLVCGVILVFRYKGIISSVYCFQRGGKCRVCELKKKKRRKNDKEKIFDGRVQIEYIKVKDGV